MTLTAAQWWSLSAFLVTAGGLVMAAWGARMTRKEFDPDHPGIFVAIAEAIKHKTAALWIALKGRLGLSRPQNASGTLDLSSEGIGSAEAIPEPTVTTKQLTMEQRVMRLETSLGDLVGDVDKLHQVHRADATELRQSMNHSRSEQAKLVKRLELRDKRIATGGFVVEVVGLWFAAVGAALALIADLVVEMPQ